MGSSSFPIKNRFSGCIGSIIYPKQNQWFALSCIFSGITHLVIILIVTIPLLFYSKIQHQADAFFVNLSAEVPVGSITSENISMSNVHVKSGNKNLRKEILSPPKKRQIKSRQDIQREHASLKNEVPMLGGEIFSSKTSAGSQTFSSGDSLRKVLQQSWMQVLVKHPDQKSYTWKHRISHCCQKNRPGGQGCVAADYRRKRSLVNVEVIEKAPYGFVEAATDAVKRSSLFRRGLEAAQWHRGLCCLSVAMNGDTLPSFPNKDWQ